MGGLLLTLPLAVRRRAPLAVAVVFASVAALDAILGGPPPAGLFEGEPPPFAPLAAGVITFYSLGAYADDRRALAGAGLGVAGVWVAVIATKPTRRASCSPPA